MTAWLVILSVGAGSYVLRALPIALDGRFTRSPSFERTITHAGTAAIAALIVVGLRRGSSAEADIPVLAITVAVALAIAIRGGSMLRVLVIAGGSHVLAQLAMSLLP
jgi:branched-subunit amino acid transport protein